MRIFVRMVRVVVKTPFWSFNERIDEEIKSNYNILEDGQIFFLELVPLACFCIVFNQCFLFKPVIKD